MQLITLAQNVPNNAKSVLMEEHALLVKAAMVLVCVLLGLIPVHDVQLVCRSILEKSVVLVPIVIILLAIVSRVLLVMDNVPVRWDGIY